MVRLQRMTLRHFSPRRLFFFMALFKANISKTAIIFRIKNRRVQEQLCATAFNRTSPLGSVSRHDIRHFKWFSPGRNPTGARRAPLPGQSIPHRHSGDFTSPAFERPGGRTRRKKRDRRATPASATHRPPPAGTAPKPAQGRLETCKNTRRTGLCSHGMPSMPWVCGQKAHGTKHYPAYAGCLVKKSRIASIIRATWSLWYPK